MYLKAIFFNSERGFKVFIKLKNKFLFDIYLCQKNLNKDIQSRLKKEFFKFKLVNKISTRLIWSTLHKMKMYKGFPQMNLKNTNKVYKRIINLLKYIHTDNSCSYTVDMILNEYNDFEGSWLSAVVYSI